MGSASRDGQVKVGHHCHARGCEVPVPPEMLMCKQHWFMVPAAIRRRVWATYQSGQCDLDPLPSKAWHRAADEAIAAVAVKEGRTTQEQADQWVQRHDAR